MVSLISLIVGIVLLFVGLHIFLSAVWESFCYLMVALMIRDETKPNQFTFTIGWKVQWLPPVFWLAGTLVLVLR